MYSYPPKYMNPSSTCKTFTFNLDELRNDMPSEVRLETVRTLTLFPPKTNIFVYGKNYTFSKKGCVHKVRCYSVCIDTA